VANIQEVSEFWNQQSCGEVYAHGGSDSERFTAQERTRYNLEPFIYEFAKFADGKDSDVLEIGVGMGADHLQWAKSNPSSLVGIDLTSRAVDFTSNRLRNSGFAANVFAANAERLPFRDCAFDIVYSWGVLHHSENPDRAIDEVFRVLRHGGVARVMIYQKYSIVGVILWLRHGALRGKSLEEIYAEYLESPGTHAYSLAQARQLFARFHSTNIQIRLSAGDLLLAQAGQRHQGRMLDIARRWWPRWLIKRLPGWGLFMLIEAKK
jgi:ubiquinone/menaquinone biosynthesis C-methylase UbiE